MELKLIYARSRNGVIGRDGQLPWHLPADLAHFKQTTLGQAVVMGRKTWDSLPERFRPLPGRTNIVITRQTDWHAPGALVAHSLEQAMSLCPAPGPLWVIGGADIYAQALPLARLTSTATPELMYSMRVLPLPSMVSSPPRPSKVFHSAELAALTEVPEKPLAS